MVDLPDNKAMLQVFAFAISHYAYLLCCLNISIDSPEATRLTIQNITFLMRMHKQVRTPYASHPYFRDWIKNPSNPLYQLNTIEGLLVCSTDPYAEDIFLPEVQQFIYYIGASKWRLPPSLDSRVVERFRRIWGVEMDRTPVLPFPDPGERWFSDRESERSDEDEEEDEDDEFVAYDEFLNSMMAGDVERYGDVEGYGDMEGYMYDDTEQRTGTTVTYIDDEPDVVTPEDIMRYFHVAEEAGLRSQDRRRRVRRVGLEQLAAEAI